MNLHIIKPQKRDEEEIKRLFDRTITQNFKDYGYDAKYREDMVDEIRKQVTALEEYYTSEGKNIYFLIAKENDKVIGTIAYGKPNADIEKYYLKKTEHMPEIKSVYILPEYQGRGVGTKLVAEMTEILRQKGFKEFCLDSGYPKAQQFWRSKLGEPVITIHNRWGAGNDYLIWHARI